MKWRSDAVSDVLCMYWTTLGVRPCLDNVISTSAALLRHGTLCTGHQLVIALNNSVKSSLRASSSAGDGRLHSRTNTCPHTTTPVVDYIATPTPVHTPPHL